MHIEGPEYAPISGAPPKQLIIFLHGLGSDGHDLISLAPMFATTFPAAHFLAPNAPFSCDTAPYGYQWFSLQQWTEAAMWEGLEKVGPMLQVFIDQQLKRFALPEEALALIGFSQGTMTALHVALQRKATIGGLVGYSGALIAPHKLAPRIHAKPPVCLIHGNMDIVVPYMALHMSATALEAYGICVEQHTCIGLGHSIDHQGITIGTKFLKDSFQP